MSKDKNTGIDEAISLLNKKFGDGAIMRLGSNAKMKVESISTGVLSVDVALGVGGIPSGRIVEIYGPESGGKTTLALQTVAAVQKNGGVAAFVDAEHALDPSYAAALGVDIDNTLISQPSSGEEALEMVEALVRSNAVQLIVVDSVAALVPRKELEGDMGDSHVGLQARLMSQAMRKLTGAASSHNCTIIFINQIREKVGVMFGNPEVTPGGRALRFFASVRMEVRKVEALKDKAGNETGNRVKVKVVKNKVAPPFRVGEGEIWFGEGFSKEASVLDVAATEGLIVRSGAWYSYGETRIGQGRDNSIKFLKDNPEVLEQLESLLREKFFS